MKKSVLFNIFLIGLFLFGISRLIFLTGGSIESLFSYGLYPFIELQSALVSGVKRWTQEKRTYKDLLNKLSSEQQRCQELQKELVEARSSNHYRKNTAELQEFLERYALKDAHIAFISFKHFDRSHFFIVDKGSRAGIEKDMIAVYQSCLVGRVTEVYPLYSKVMLISDPLCKVAAVCSDTGAKGIYEGTGNLQRAVLGYVDPSDEVKVGDTVLSSGKGLIFPRGFGLGKVSQIDSEGARYVVHVSLLIDYATLEYCALISDDSKFVDTSISGPDK
ncbi:rod shape-determining protein MreC [Candidatus Dependentiae bacterium]|nr:rod shape-determining protein MreC [Candidatus Dependentiae bacterium]